MKNYRYHNECIRRNQAQGGSEPDPPSFFPWRLQWGLSVFQWGSNPHNSPANFYPALDGKFFNLKDVILHHTVQPSRAFPHCMTYVDNLQQCCRGLSLTFWSQKFIWWGEDIDQSPFLPSVFYTVLTLLAIAGSPHGKRCKPPVG